VLEGFFKEGGRKEKRTVSTGKERKKNVQRGKGIKQAEKKKTRETVEKEGKTIKKDAGKKKPTESSKKTKSKQGGKKGGDGNIKTIKRPRRKGRGKEKARKGILLKGKIQKVY